MKQQMNSRLLFLDSLKGLLIIMVVIGHVIQSSNPDYQHDILFRFIYSFHMPLFLAISGYLTYKPKYDSVLIKKRAVQLLVSFVAWAFLSPVLQKGVIDIDTTFNALLYPDNGLWFLYNLFVYSAIFNISERLSEMFAKKQELILCAFVFLLFVLWLYLRRSSIALSCAGICHSL